MVKKQVFELLSSMCLYCSRGYDLALDALENYRVSYLIIKFTSYKNDYPIIVCQLVEIESDFVCSVVGFRNIHGVPNNLYTLLKSIFPENYDDTIMFAFGNVGF